MAVNQNTYQNAYTGVLIVAGLLMGIWGAHLAGLFQLPEWLLYDRFVRAAPEQKLAPQKILLIEADPADMFSGDRQWLKLNRHLQNLGVGQIIYTFIPEGLSRDFFLHARSLDKICFGRRLRRDRTAGNRPRLEPVPAQAAGLDLVFGVATIPPPEYGLYRFHQPSIRIGETRYPTLVGAAARQLLGRPLPLSDRFLVNFNGQTQQLGRVSLETALAGQLVPELVAGKSVLIGMADNSFIPGLQTPITAPGQGLSPLEYQGLALDTLVSGKTISRTGPGIDLLCLLAVCFMGLIAYQVMKFSFALWFTVISLGVYLVICWAVFSWLRIWPPVFAILLTQCLTLGVILRLRQLQDLALLQTVVTRLTDRIKAYIIPEDFISTRQHWDQISTMVSQTLNLSRSIFLETVEKDHRVREIAADNCSFADIQERRRDFERTPYTTALTENGPIMVSSYLVPDKEDEMQFLVPLNFADQILGFWAFGINPEEYAAFNHFEDMVNDYSQQIAEMLYQRQKWQQQAHARYQPLRQLLQLQAGRTISREVHETYIFVEKKLLLFESVLDELKTAVIVYDLFGHVMQINPAMEQILREMDLQPFELTAAEIAGRLCQIDITQARRQLNHVVTVREAIIMPVITSSSEDRGHILCIGPIGLDPNRSGGLAGVQPFQIQGILFELYEISQLQDVHNLMDNLLEDLHEQQDQVIEAMKAYLDEMEETGFDEHSIKNEFPALRQAVNNCLELRDRMNTYLSREYLSGTRLDVPILYTKYLDQAIQRINRAGADRRVKITRQSPEKPAPVFADPHLLFKLFYAILTILFEDAAENTDILIRIEPDEAGLRFTFWNQGFGMPDEMFNYYMTSGKAKASQDFSLLRDMALHVRQWGGDLTGSSAVGRGMRFALTLKKLP